MDGQEFDSDYIAWLQEISEYCKCCSYCCDVPCGGVQSGGLCDNSTCHCSEVEGNA